MMTISRFCELRLNAAYEATREEERILQRDLTLGAVLYASAAAASFDEGTEIYKWYQKEVEPKFNQLLYGVE